VIGAGVAGSHKEEQVSRADTANETVRSDSRSVAAGGQSGWTERVDRAGVRWAGVGWGGVGWGGVGWGKRQITGKRRLAIKWNRLKIQDSTTLNAASARKSSQSIGLTQGIRRLASHHLAQLAGHALIPRQPPALRQLLHYPQLVHVAQVA
jgi:hypothetical protein